MNLGVLWVSVPDDGPWPDGLFDGLEPCKAVSNDQLHHTCDGQHMKPRKGPARRSDLTPAVGGPLAQFALVQRLAGLATV